MTDEDDEFVRIEKESLWRKRQIEENLGQPIYFKPKKEWVGLTDDEMFDCLLQSDGQAKRLPFGFKWFAEAIEAKLKEKNAT